MMDTLIQADFVVDVALSSDERATLTAQEAVIERGLNSFIEVGAALLRIRDNRLYRQDYGTFEDYCRERWGWARNYANKLIGTVGVIQNLGTIVPILPSTESQARPLTSLSPDKQIEAWQRAIDTAPDGRITAAHVQSVVDGMQIGSQLNADNPSERIRWMQENEKRPVSYHVSDDSYEWYTPCEYIEAARAVMGSIDIDPATSEEAQERIQARTYYTKDTNGLDQEWRGNVWINPPYNMPLIEQFIDKAIEGYLSGAIQSVIILTNNSTDTGWFHKLLKASGAVCFTRGRLKFWNGNETLATRQGQAIFYLGVNPHFFYAKFREFGEVMRRYDN